MSDLEQSKSEIAISVVIPAYNEAAYLPDTMASIRRSQTMLLDTVEAACDVVVVNDQSTDTTAEVATRLGARVVLGPRNGIGAARNVGARASRGRVLVFIDADTWIDAAVLPEIHRAVLAGVRTGAVAAEYQSNRLAVRCLLALWRWYAPRRNMTQGVCQFYERVLFSELGGYRTDLKMAEDTDLYHRALTAIAHYPGQFAVIDRVRVHPSMRRYEQRSSVALLAMTNPLTTKLFRGSQRVWRDWYVDPPR